MTRQGGFNCYVKSSILQEVAGGHGIFLVVLTGYVDSFSSVKFSHWQALHPSVALMFVFLQGWVCLDCDWADESLLFSHLYPANGVHLLLVSILSFVARHELVKLSFQSGRVPVQ